MKHLKKYNEGLFTKLFKKKDNYITQHELDTVYDIIDMFADDNDLGQRITWDDQTLKDINYYTKYSSRDEVEISVDNGRDINFNFFSNNLEFIEINNKFNDMDMKNPKLNLQVQSLLKRIKKLCPDLKVEFPEADKFKIIITRK